MYRTDRYRTMLLQRVSLVFQSAHHQLIHAFLLFLSDDDLLTLQHTTYSCPAETLLHQVMLGHSVINKLY